MGDVVAAAHDTRGVPKWSSPCVYIVGAYTGGRGFQILNGSVMAPFSALSWNAYFLGCSRLYTWRHSLSSKYNM